MKYSRESIELPINTSGSSEFHSSNSFPFSHTLNQSDQDSREDSYGLDLDRLVRSSSGTPRRRSKRATPEEQKRPDFEEGSIHHDVKEGKLCVVAGKIREEPAVLQLRSSSGLQPLAVALESSKVGIAEILIRAGADINIKDSHERTILHYCILQRKIFGHLFDLVIKHRDIAVNARDRQGATALYLAVVHQHNIRPRRILALLQRGADVNISTIEGISPFLLVCSQGNLKMMKLFIDHMADVRKRDNRGETALHMSVRSNSEAAVEFLLTKANIDHRITNMNGKTAHDMCENPRIRKLLEDFAPSSKYWKWEIDEQDIDIYRDKKLGKGSFSIVYLGSLHCTPVAVKELNMGAELAAESSPLQTSRAVENLRFEIGVMSDISHPNVLRFLGAVTKPPSFLVVTEFMPGGSLWKFCRSNDGPIAYHILIKCLKTTARGMAWLHSRKPPILHRDLHSNNILVKGAGECCVADFGVSDIVGGYQSHSKKLYQRVMPPEVQEDRSNFTKKSDVYMYGLVIYEVLTKQKALPKIWDLEAKTKDILKFYPLNKGIHEVIELMKHCTTIDPEKRPNFETIIARLDSIPS